MARPAPPPKKAGTQPVPPPPPRPTKKQLAEEKVLCVPMEFKAAGELVGLFKLVTRKGPGKGGNNTMYRALFVKLKERQHYIKMVMQGMRVMVKRVAALQELEEAYAPGNNGIFRVELVINSRKTGKDLKYQVLWEQFPLEFATWEPAEDLTMCKHLVKVFHQTYKYKPGQPSGKMHDVLGDLDVEVADEISESEDNANGQAGAPVVPERQLPGGGEAALAMQPIGPSPRRIPGIAPSVREMPVRTRVSVYENLNDRALSSGKVKAKFNAGGADDEDRDAETPSRNNRNKRKSRAGGRAKLSIAGAAASADSADEDNEVMSPPLRGSAQRPRRSAQVVLISSDSDSGAPHPLRKKAKEVAAAVSAAASSRASAAAILNEALQMLEADDDEMEDEFVNNDNNDNESEISEEF